MATDTEPEPTTAAKPAFSLPSAPRESLSSRSAVILKRYLLAEGLQPGDRLPPERRLAEALNVSRTVLREAINQLVGEGLVSREASRSPVVTDFDRARLASDMSMLDGPDTEIRDLIELRVMVELGAIEAIVERASDDDVAEMERWVAEGERRVQEGKPMSVADLRFHAALLRSLGNRAVDALLPLIEENMRENLLIDTHELSGQHTATDDRVIGQHRRILEAVRARDPQAAREAMREHLDPYLHPPAAD
jgi:GntR family transcriptional repressor for pyruvate dehydrogenase complex